MQIVKVAWIKANYILVNDQAIEKKKKTRQMCVFPEATFEVL